MSWSSGDYGPWEDGGGHSLLFRMHETYPTANCSYNVTESCDLNSEQVVLVHGKYLAKCSKIVHNKLTA